MTLYHAPEYKSSYQYKRAADYAFGQKRPDPLAGKVRQYNKTHAYEKVREYKYRNDYLSHKSSKNRARPAVAEEFLIAPGAVLLTENDRSQTQNSAAHHSQGKKTALSLPVEESERRPDSITAPSRSNTDVGTMVAAAAAAPADDRRIRSTGDIRLHSQRENFRYYYQGYHYREYKGNYGIPKYKPIPKHYSYRSDFNYKAHWKYKLHPWNFYPLRQAWNSKKPKQKAEAARTHDEPRQGTPKEQRDKLPPVVATSEMTKQPEEQTERLSPVKDPLPKQHMRSKSDGGNVNQDKDTLPSIAAVAALAAVKPEVSRSTGDISNRERKDNGFRPYQEYKGTFTIPKYREYKLDNHFYEGHAYTGYRPYKLTAVNSEGFQHSIGKTKGRERRSDEKPKRKQTAPIVAAAPVAAEEARKTTPQPPAQSLQDESSAKQEKKTQEPTREKSSPAPVVGAAVLATKSQDTPKPPKEKTPEPKREKTPKPPREQTPKPPREQTPQQPKVNSPVQPLTQERSPPPAVLAAAVPVADERQKTLDLATDENTSVREMKSGPESPREKTPEAPQLTASKPSREERSVPPIAAAAAVPIAAARQRTPDRLSKKSTPKPTKESSPEPPRQNTPKVSEASVPESSRKQTPVQPASHLSPSPVVAAAMIGVAAPVSSSLNRAASPNHQPDPEPTKAEGISSSPAERSGTSSPRRHKSSSPKPATSRKTPTPTGRKKEAAVVAAAAVGGAAILTAAAAAGGATEIDATPSPPPAETPQLEKFKKDSDDKVEKEYQVVDKSAPATSPDARTTGPPSPEAFVAAVAAGGATGGTTSARATTPHPEDGKSSKSPAPGIPVTAAAAVSNSAGTTDNQVPFPPPREAPTNKKPQKEKQDEKKAKSDEKAPIPSLESPEGFDDRGSQSPSPNIPLVAPVVASSSNRNKKSPSPPDENDKPTSPEQNKDSPKPPKPESPDDNRSKPTSPEKSATPPPVTAATAAAAAAAAAQASKQPAAPSAEEAKPAREEPEKRDKSEKHQTHEKDEDAAALPDALSESPSRASGGALGSIARSVAKFRYK